MRHSRPGDQPQQVTDLLDKPCSGGVSTVVQAHRRHQGLLATREI